MAAKKYYALAIVDGELRPVCYAEFNWKDDSPFNGTEVTNEPFTGNDYKDWVLKDGEWIYKPI